MKNVDIIADIADIKILIESYACSVAAYEDSSETEFILQEKLEKLKEDYLRMRHERDVALAELAQQRLERERPCTRKGCPVCGGPESEGGGPESDYNG